MGKTMFKDTEVGTTGELPAVGTTAPDFQLIKADLSQASLKDFPGKKILSIFPSIDTPVCATSTTKFNDLAAQKGCTVLTVSQDLPFALKRFCGGSEIDRVETLSAFRSNFGEDYGVALEDSPLQGLFARAIVVLDEDNKVLHSQLVASISMEPDYAQALSALG